MSAATAFPEQMVSPAAVTSSADAKRLADHLSSMMDELIAVLQQETELVRAGRLRAAVALQKTKGDLTRAYIADTLRLRASQPYMARATPGTLTALRQRHD